MQGSADSRGALQVAGRSRGGSHVANMCNAVVLWAQFGGTPRESSLATPPLHLQLPVHGVALELCSNACTAFRAFRRSLMVLVSLVSCLWVGVRKL